MSQFERKNWDLVGKSWDKIWQKMVILSKSCVQKENISSICQIWSQKVPVLVPVFKTSWDQKKHYEKTTIKEDLGVVEEGECGILEVSSRKS